MSSVINLMSVVKKNYKGKGTNVSQIIFMFIKDGPLYPDQYIYRTGILTEAVLHRLVKRVKDTFENNQVPF